jgi:hypothetical protein
MEQLELDRASADKRGRVEVAESAEPATAIPIAPEWLTIGQRLAAIRSECFGIGKQPIKMETKSGGSYTIQAHTVEAILAEVRPLLSKYGVDLTPNLVSREYTGNRCDVIVDFRFEVLDDHASELSEYDFRVIRWAGAGTDNSDKGFAKAGTNALKEMLKKVFLITDRDDAKEEEDKVEHQTDEGVRRGDLDHAREERRAAIEQWAKTFKAAIEKATDAKDISRLQRENNDQLMSGDLPEVTRVFFIELLQKRKAELET